MVWVPSTKIYVRFVLSKHVCKKNFFTLTKLWKVEKVPEVRDDYGTGSCCLYGAVRSGFEGGKSTTREILGGGPKNWDFLGPEMATSAASATGAIWAQKS
jgi:hypothetical protein